MIYFATFVNFCGYSFSDTNFAKKKAKGKFRFSFRFFFAYSVVIWDSYLMRRQR
jgi:hypothetical protein